MTPDFGPESLPVERQYFPLDVPVSGRAGRELALPVQLLAPAPPRRLFVLREITARLQRRYPARPASAAEFNLLALLCRAQRLVAARYLAVRQGHCDARGLVLTGNSQPLATWPLVVERFVVLYPPPLGLAAEARPQQVAIELPILAILTENRAATPFGPLFDAAEFDRSTPWRGLLAEFDRLLARERGPGRLGGSLLALLREPLAAAPDSLAGQLRYVRQAWGEILPEDWLAGLETAFAILEEEQAVRHGGPGESPVPHFGGGPGTEPEAFSRDADWMSSTVLLAKSVYVWLDQLSRHYGRAITRLDRIPGAELDRLAAWGFSALWLIGLWRRSTASQSIKQRMGNPEAVASAYSLEDYVVADDLGGDDALAFLEAECGRRGIRLACDVVPNHTGIDSRWVREHPDWFIQIEHPPYPAYRYSGPDLSSDPALELRIEDGYWNHSDAAVVFERRDHRDGSVRYLYHGNDGTHMPWNDTAQLNFLLPQVREAMIGTILQVARRFRIIRFDAAMTLAKSHFQRLWFPLPGGGAGVPSRAEHAMSREDFEAVFPVEFWREVVDRVAAEVPDTLLLAEAFWLMEGYFVRTLGMHRVYNSAFMNMLKQEENAKYRSVLKNVLEFDPEILKRFVNFMNNPDEATAVEQFGKQDKYFGVAVLLATLPGLPMFGHGQIEGLREKYGMEYRRAYWDETPDAGFIAHHEAQICPLLRRRWLFSEATHFELFDFESGGHVNEDVFAYSNARGGERSLVVYHNRAADTGGWLRRSVAKAVAGSDGERRPRQTTFAAALGIDPGRAALWRWREHHSGEEFLLAANELAAEGFYLQLGAYAYRVFTDLRPQPDPDGLWAELARKLGGRGVADLDRELRRLRFREVTAALRRLLALPLPLAEKPQKPRAQKPPALPASETFQRALAATFAALAAFGAGPDSTAATAAVRADLAAIERGLGLSSRSSRVRAGLERLRQLIIGAAPEAGSGSLLSALLVCKRGEALASGWYELLDDGMFPAGNPPAPGALLELLLRQREAVTRPTEGLAALFREGGVQGYLLVHTAEGSTWFNRERAQGLFDGLTLAGTLHLCQAAPAASRNLATALAALAERHTALSAAAAAVGYRYDKFLAAISKEGSSK